MVYDLADDLPAMIHDSPQVPSFLRNAGQWFGEWMVKKTVRRSARVIGITDSFQRKYGISDDKFKLVPNGVDTLLFKNVRSTIRSDNGLDGSFVLGYVGVLREWVDLQPVYQALKKMEDVKLLVVGQEGLYHENRKMVSELGIQEKVIFTGNVPYARVPEYVAAMDVCLIPFRNNPISQNAVPLKLFEYMACEKPVISAHLNSVEKIAGDRIFYADTSGEYFSRVLALKNEGIPPAFLEENRIFVEKNYEWQSLGESLETVLEGII
jgi:glycosyltransferase involved in cell wall biosynthesis